MNKSLPIAYLLWLFTGVFGGHRWYLGYKKSALAMSVVGGLFIYFIAELIVYVPSEQLYIVSVQIFTNPIGMMETVVSSRHTQALKLLFIGTVIFIWITPLFLLFDCFWLYFKLKKQPNTVTQQQVEAFD
ncbi:TM2 domain-containing protein [Kiloniella majae]|uniref:NINE protein n=1 Tax=Kiloniella majae TaxID=1938558 RepID=UPI000A2785FC